MNELEIKTHVTHPSLDRWCLSALLLAGALQNITGRMAMYTDGIHYLDLANCWRRGDWWVAVDAFRSPLYPWIAAAWLQIWKPGMEAMFPSIHVLNFLIFAGVTLCFRFCLQQHIRTAAARSQADGKTRLDSFSWTVLGWSLYLLASIKLTPSHQHAPDMMVMGACFLATGFLLRIWRKEATKWSYLQLGIVLGLGYLTKAILFPVSLLYLFSLFILTAKHKQGMVKAFLTVLTFCVVCTPWVIALHWKTDHWTTGAAGKLNHAWVFVYAGQSKNTSDVQQGRLISKDPDYFQYNTTAGRTYAADYDPALWKWNYPVPFNLRDQVHVAVVNLFQYRWFLNYYGAPFVTLILFWMFLRGSLLSGVKDLIAECQVLLPIASVLAGYLLLWVYTRFIGGYFVLIFMGAFLAMAFEAGSIDVSVLRKAAIAIVATTMLLHVPDIANDFRKEESESRQATQLKVAQAMQKLGLKPGDTVAVVQRHFWEYWAFLARVHIVASTAEGGSEDFWKVSQDRRAKIIEAARSTQARWLLVNSAPDKTTENDWVRLGDTGYYAIPLN